MWRLQLKKLDAWSRLCALSLGAHLIFLIIVFFVYKGDSYHINLTFNARDLNDATIIFMPGSAKLYAKQMMNKGNIQKSNKINSVGKNIPPAPKEITQNTSKSEVKSTVAKTSTPQSSATKTAKSTTPPATRLATTAGAKTKTAKKINKREVKKNKNLSSQKTKSDNHTKTKKAFAIEEVEKEKQVVKTEQLKKEQIKQPEAQNISAPADIKAEVNSNTNSDGLINENVIFINNKDLDALQTQHIIQEELSRHFTPPAGLSKELQCELTLTVGFDGVVTRVEIAKSSGAAIFDMSARTAVGKLTLPPWTYGKELTITFNN